MSELPERFFVSEIIRKHIFLQYRQEVPYNVAGACGRRGRGRPELLEKALLSSAARWVLAPERGPLPPCGISTATLPIPPPAAVEVTTYKERSKGKDLVEADIVLGGWGRVCDGCRQAWWARVSVAGGLAQSDLSLCRMRCWATESPPCHSHELSAASSAHLPACLPAMCSPAEKDRQKGIIIGRAGSALKQLSTASRVEIEEFLGRPVFLNLSVKVREGWRKDAAQLERLGY